MKMLRRAMKRAFSESLRPSCVQFLDPQDVLATGPPLARKQLARSGVSFVGGEDQETQATIGAERDWVGTGPTYSA